MVFPNQYKLCTAASVFSLMESVTEISGVWLHDSAGSGTLAGHANRPVARACDLFVRAWAGGGSHFRVTRCSNLSMRVRWRRSLSPAPRYTVTCQSLPVPVRACSPLIPCQPRAPVRRDLCRRPPRRP